MSKMVHIIDSIKSFLKEKRNTVYDPNFDFWNDYVLEDEFRFSTRDKN